PTRHESGSHEPTRHESGSHEPTRHEPATGDGAGPAAADGTAPGPAAADRPAPTAAAADAVIEIEGLHKTFGDLHVLRDCELTVHPGEVCVLVGPSGSGKSTLLRCINPLEDPTAGTGRIGGG